MSVKTFEELEIWQMSTKLAIEIYNLSEKGALAKDWGMKDQVRRCASSVAANIAEGFEYDNNKDFIRYLRIAKGSCGELRTHCFIIKGAGFIDEETQTMIADKTKEISARIGKLINYLKNYEEEKLLKNKK